MAAMKNVLVTGSEGFIGKNLTEALRCKTEVVTKTFDILDARAVLNRYLEEADIIYHLAGVNRPERLEDYEKVNLGLTSEMIGRLEKMSRRPSIVFSSSIQATLDNPYGVSKKKAEEALCEYAQRTGAQVMIFRLPNVFGKWCRPNYNSVVATFCYNAARGLTLDVSDSYKEIELVHVDDVVTAFLRSFEVATKEGEALFATVEPTFRVTLGKLAGLIQEFATSRQTLRVPDLGVSFVRRLYGTFQSYLSPKDFAYGLQQRKDERGTLAELLKGEAFGQLFISRTGPGITRGNHYHHTKVEKFVVLEGDAIIRFRHIVSGEIISCSVSGEEFKVVDIPPGWAHNIQNIGTTELVVLFWASEVFEPERPDTYASEV
jgi:UDP-2-acetamido-2,6-beta-L-arabino-hexul-4-ose reductase